MKSVFRNSAGGCFILVATLISSALIIFTLLPYPAFAGQISATTQEFQVNVTTDYDQKNPCAGIDSLGGSVVMWEQSAYDPTGLSSGMSIKGRLFNPSGVPVTGEFSVNSHESPTYFPCMPEVAMAPDGSFVGVWLGFGSAGEPDGIVVQRFAPGGLMLGEETVVSNGGFNCFPSVSMNSLGGYAVCWEHTDSSTMQVDVSCRLFDAYGAALGGLIQLPMQSSLIKSMPCVGMDAAGNFVLVWLTGTTASTDRDVMAMRFDALGGPLSSAFRVNTTQGVHTMPDVSANAYGEFVVTWHGRNDAGEPDIYMQYFGADGQPSGPEVTVNLTALDDIVSPSVGLDDGGNSVVSWHNYSPETGTKGIFTQLVEGSGASGCEVQMVDPELTSSYWSVSPAVAVSGSGMATVCWESSGQDGYGMGVFARCYLIEASSPPTPGAPAGLIAAEHPESGAELSWLPEPDVNEYTVYRDGAEIARTNGTYYYDSAARSDGSYCYTVTATSPACYNGVESAHSNAACVFLQQAPPAPTDKPYLVYEYLTGTATLSWSAPKLDYKVVGYEVHRQGIYLATTAGLSYKDTGLGNGRYGYAVYAVDKSGKQKTSIEFELTSPRDNGNSNGNGLTNSAKK